MSQQKILHGSRAQLQVNGRTIGLFSQVSYGVQYDATPSYVLGRFSPAEITYTGQEAISVTATGFRVVDNGPHAVASVPKLQELLNHEDITLAIYDRQTNKLIMSVVGCRPTGFSTGVATRSVADVTVNFLGLRLSDESGESNESSGASDLLTSS